MNLSSFKTTPIERVAIVRSLPGLGDLLCAVPTFRALKQAFPQAKISLIGLPIGKVFVNRFSNYLDEWLEFPGYPGIPEGWHSPQQTLNGLTQLQHQNYDLAIQLHGSGIISNLFTILLGAKLNAGFFLPGQYCPDSNSFFPYPETENEIRRNLKLMEYLGIPHPGENLEFPVWESDEFNLQTLPEFQVLKPDQYICIHPGSSVAERRWNVQHFAKIADHLAGQGFQIVLTGTEAEFELTQTVANIMQHSAINLAGKTALGTLAALLQKSSLLICNDTGVSHLAAALQVNSVVIFSNSDPLRWSPLNKQKHRVIDLRCLSILKGESTDKAILETVLAEATDLLKQEVMYAI